MSVPMTVLLLVSGSAIFATVGTFFIEIDPYFRVTHDSLSSVAGDCAGVDLDNRDLVDQLQGRKRVRLKVHIGGLESVDFRQFFSRSFPMKCKLVIIMHGFALVTCGSECSKD